MQFNRLNVLVVLSVVTIAGGALFATGAFTTVEAERSIDVDTEGDASALLQLEDAGSQLVDVDANGMLVVDENRLNQEAMTEADPAINVTNNGDSDVGLYVNATSAEFDVLHDGTSIEGSGAAVDVNSGQTIQLTIQIDLRDGDVENIPAGITITAESSAHSTA